MPGPNLTPFHPLPGLCMARDAPRRLDERGERLRGMEYVPASSFVTIRSIRHLRLSSLHLPLRLETASLSAPSWLDPRRRVFAPQGTGKLDPPLLICAPLLATKHKHASISVVNIEFESLRNRFEANLLGTSANRNQLGYSGYYIR